MTRRYARAAQAFEDFSGHKPTRVTKAQLQHTDAAGWKMGPAVGIAYEARRDGVTRQYFHEFAKSARPDLVSRDDGKQLFLVGGKYTVTNRGIEDMPELFVVNPSPRRRASTKGKTMAAKKRRKPATRQVAVFRANPAPKKRRRAPARRSYRRNPVAGIGAARPKRRRFRRNPIGGGSGFKGLGQLIVPAMGVGGGAVGAEVLMGYLPIPESFKSGIARHITKGAVGIAAGMIIAKLFKMKKLGLYVSAGAVVIATHDAIKEFIAARLPALPSSGFGQYVTPLPSQFGGMGYVNPAATVRFGEYVPPMQFNGMSQAYPSPGGETDFTA